jgi:hypothetical protein
MYIVGQERRLVNPPSQVVAGVRTVTTNMNGRDALPRMSRPFAFLVERSYRIFLRWTTSNRLPDCRFVSRRFVRLLIAGGMKHDS